MLKNLIVLATLCFVHISGTVFHDLMDVISMKPLNTQFKLWHYALKRPYDLNSELALAKYRTFKANLRIIQVHNSKQSNYQLGVGPFTDLTWDEFKEAYLTTNLVPHENQVAGKPNNKLIDSNLADEEEIEFRPEPTQGNVITSSDWRTLHPKAKNQGGCGSCWAFATVASFEGQLILKNQIYTEVSEQELVDCTANQPGCKGGYYNYAYDYVKQYGLARGDVYKYVANSMQFHQKCYAYPKFIRTFDTLYSCSTYQFFSVYRCTLDTLYGYLRAGPAATLIQVNDGLQHYRQGQWYPTHCKEINHAVELVYFSVDKYTLVGSSYIRNSWGDWWGQNGIGEIAVTKNQGLLGCGTLVNGFLPYGLKLQ